MSQWRTQSISSFCEKIYSGGTPNTKKAEYWGGNLKWLSSGETRNKYIFDTEKRITELGAKESSTRLAYSGDVVMASAGQGYTRGQVSMLKTDTFVNQSVIVFRTDSKELLSDYLYYNLSNRYDELRALSDSNSIRGSITTKLFNSMEISIPTLDIQKKIVDTLGLIDEKIENNKKINHHLAEMAKSIFDSYFIDLEPYGGVKPDDWQFSNLTGIANYLNGLAMQKFRPQDNEQGLPVLKIKELRQGFTDSTSDLCSPNIRRDYIIHDGDVIFSWSGSLLVDFWTGGECGLNQHLFKVTSDTYDKWFYYAWTKHHLDRFVKIAADRATTMGHIKRDALEKAEVLIPSDEDFEEIGKMLKPIYDQILNNRVESRKLVALRDNLLPKLMSGEISVT